MSVPPDPPRVVFVTGTDTGVGKTTVSRALLGAWRRRGQRVAAVKPLETGISPDDLAGDAAALAAASGQSLAQTMWRRFGPPLAPQAAAAQAGTPIDPRQLEAACQGSVPPAPRLLIEGAGGLLVPIAPGYTMADLAQAVCAAVIIVARTRLGTINHALLTIAECRRRGLPIVGLVLNRATDETGPEDADNAALIAAHGGVPVWGPLPHLRDVAAADVSTLADAAERHLPVQEIFASCYLRRPHC
jgi:dethiobiotin synthetase